METWPLLRDIAIMGLGIAVIASQVLIQVAWGRPPSDVLLAVGLALTGPAGYAHVRTVLGAGPGPGPSSPPSPPPGLPSSPGPSLPEATHD